MKDHERIWLQHPDTVDPEGRMWCENDAWEHPGIEYVRADLAKTVPDVCSYRVTRALDAKLDAVWTLLNNGHRAKAAALLAQTAIDALKPKP